MSIEKNDLEFAFSQLTLSDEQKQIYEKLSELKKYPLAEIYYGALQIYSNKYLNDRYSFAAHGFRELINLLGRTFSEIEIAPSILDSKVNNLKRDYDNFFYQSEMEKCIECDKKIHSQKSLAFYEKVKSFFAWFTSKPSSKENYQHLLSSVNPSSISLPYLARNSFSNQLSELYGYFTGWSHHNPKGQASFDEKLAELQKILTDLFYPPTFLRHDEIDEIISEAENRDQ